MTRVRYREQGRDTGQADADGLGGTQRRPVPAAVPVTGDVEERARGGRLSARRNRILPPWDDGTTPGTPDSFPTTKEGPENVTVCRASRSAKAQ
ncbi:hypothetical protein GCM10009530_22090 [Microbispora corallina]|uniref:Uncharacterized protein n=1 Tax=Microbispora corallina TaxID=83302 RepID=A0ABQ4G643_9ACTN|nr:hypothetical protein Mco01_55510 [Microbispora corallina]